MPDINIIYFKVLQYNTTVLNTEVKRNMILSQNVYKTFWVLRYESQFLLYCSYLACMYLTSEV